MRSSKPARWRCIPYPAQIERQYAVALSGIVLERLRACLQAAQQWRSEWEGVRADADDEEPVTPPVEPPIVASLNAAIQRRLAQILPLDRAYAQAVRKFSNREDEAHRKGFHMVMRDHVKLDATKVEVWKRPLLEMWEWQNIELITRMETEQLAKLKSLFIDAIRDGRSPKAVASEVKKLLDVSDKRARLIAIDQIGKLNAQLSEKRFTSAGVKRYRWRTVGDSRVRPLHRSYDGKIFEFGQVFQDSPPGSAIRCRCREEPILEDVANEPDYGDSYSQYQAEMQALSNY